MDTSTMVLGTGTISWAAKLLVDLLRMWKPETAERPGRTVLVVVLLSIVLAALLPVALGQAVTPQLLAQAVFLGLGGAAGAITSTEAHKRSRQASEDYEAAKAAEPRAGAGRSAAARVTGPAITDDWDPSRDASRDLGTGGEGWQ